MNILMVSSEAFPFAKAGGLGDVVPHLSQALGRLGHQVKIIIPRYYGIDRHSLDRNPAPLTVHLGRNEYGAALYSQQLEGGTAEIYFLEREDLYGRDGIYVDGENRDFPDNLLRFAFLSKAAFALCRQLDWYPDVIHAHDWASAPAITFLKSQEHAGPFARCAGIFSIHNIGYQGIFPQNQLEMLGFGQKEYYDFGLEYYQQICTMKSALVCADEIITVSPNYAKEILTPELGFHMDGILRERQDRLSGVLNGIDYDIWNPAADQNLAYCYDADSLEHKALNKNAVQQDAGLEISSRPALIGVVSRLVGQKGFDLLLGDGGRNIDRICSELDIQLIVLGTGEPRIEDGFRQAALRNPNLRCYIRYNEKMSHMIEAASDFFLMPSLYEPCGLTQMYALRYGSIPVVSPTGGLVDTVPDYEATTGGLGIVIDEAMDEDAVFAALKRAVDLYQHRSTQYRELQLRGMKLRFSWESAAKQYEAIYRRSIDRGLEPDF